MLFWHKHDLEKALIDLSNFTPFPDEWAVEDKVLFEQAFQFHGKSFHRIRQMVFSIVLLCCYIMRYNNVLNSCRTNRSPLWSGITILGRRLGRVAASWTVKCGLEWSTRGPQIKKRSATVWTLQIPSWPQCPATVTKTSKTMYVKRDPSYLTIRN